MTVTSVVDAIIIIIAIHHYTQPSHIFSVHHRRIFNDILFSAEQILALAIFNKLENCNTFFRLPHCF